MHTCIREYKHTCIDTLTHMRGCSLSLSLSLFLSALNLSLSNFHLLSPSLPLHTPSHSLSRKVAIYAILGVTFFMGFDDKFATFGSAMFTMFQVSLSLSHSATLCHTLPHTLSLLCARICVCVHARVRACIWMCVDVYRYVLICVDVCVCVCVCVCVW